MRNVKVILVDDNTEDANDIKKTVESFGYSVTHIAMTLEDAVKNVIESNPNIILWNIKFKDEKNDTNFILTLKSLQIPIVYLSSTEEKKLQNNQITDGYGHVLKPYDARELKQSIDMALYKRYDWFNITHQEEHPKYSGNKFKHSSHYNRILIEASLDPLITIDLQGKITDVNNATEKVTGYSMEELVGTDFSIYFTDPVKAIKGYEKVLKMGDVRDYLLNILHKDGSTKTVLYNASTYKNESGQVVGIFAAARDITQIKITEDKLKDSEERMRITLEAANIGVWDWDVKNDKWYASPSYYSMLGYKPQKGPADHDTWIKRIHPKDRSRIKEMINKVKVQNFDKYAYKAQILHADGNYRWIKVSGFGIERDQNGNATRIIGIRTDITKQKKAEEELKLAGLYNRSLIEASLDPLVTIGADGKITDVNKATEDITGYLRDKLIGTDFSDYFTESFNAKLGYEQVFKDGFVRDYPLKIQHKNGRVTPVIYNASVYKDESEKVVGVFAAARDITEQKKAEDKIMMFANVVESSDDAIITKSLDGRIKSWNKGAESIYGYTSQEVLEKDISIIAPHGLKNEIKKLIKKIKLGKHLIHYETKRLRKDGTLLDVSLTLSPILDSSGYLVGISTIARDITEKKKHEKEIITAKEEWENTFDAVPDLITILDNNFHIVRANNALAARLGTTPKKSIGLTCYQVVHGLESPPSFCPHLELLKDGQEHTAEVHEEKIGGYFNVSVSPLYDAEGKISGSVHVARDITERKKSENVVKNSLKEKEVLLREIHHRVKNNMQIISSLLNLQAEYVKDPETINILQESQDRVKAMASIYDKLYQSKNLTEINFKNYIESVITNLFYSYSSNNNHILSIFDVEDIKLNIDTAIPCGLIITEIVSNCLKHAFPEKMGGKVFISLKSHDEFYELIIRDSGVGFPDNIDFKNTDSLGLQLVNNLVEQLDGQITLVKNHGTEFQITFKEQKYKDRI